MGTSSQTGYLAAGKTCTFGKGVTATATSAITAVLVKYDSLGTALWARTADGGTNTWSQFNSIVADAKGNVYVTGSLSPGIYVFDEGVLASGTRESGDRAVLVKYDSTGAAGWARTTLESSYSPRFHSVTVDGSGDVYVAG